MPGKCEHGLTTAECFVCASPKYGHHPPPVSAWVPVTERMPTAGVKVLVCYRNSYGHLRRTCAHYSPLHTVDASMWDDGEPDETEDGTFEPEGWWEEPVEIDRVEFIADEVTHWIPLPAAPTETPSSPSAAGE
jgi:hypothetical protein